ncbi:MAG: outer membrane beta-barrel protein [Bradymonadales bacterium]
MYKLCFSLCLAIVLSLTAAGASVSAQELDLRASLGGGINFGYAGGINIPFELDLGWRFNPYVGLYLDLSYEYTDRSISRGDEIPIGDRHALFFIPSLRIFMYENDIASVYATFGLGINVTPCELVRDGSARNKTTILSFLSSKFQIGADFHVTSRFWLGFAFTSHYNFYETYNDKYNSEKTTKWLHGTTTTFSLLMVASYRFL